MAVTGTIHPDRVIRNIGVQAGDALVLTKALGTGIVTTALKRRKAPRASVRAAVASMIALNDTASAVMRTFPVHACSDITGFGLLGHAFEMASGSSATIVIEARHMPLLPSARRLAEQGYLTGGCKRNRNYLTDRVVIDPSVPPGLVDVAFDPQTSGGLLIAVPARDATSLVDRLNASGIETAAIVGRVTATGIGQVRLT
jgi:selenide,water dikinase